MCILKMFVCSLFHQFERKRWFEQSILISRIIITISKLESFVVDADYYIIIVSYLEVENLELENIFPKM